MSINNVNTELERSPVGLGLRSIAEWVSYDDFTDGAGTSGDFTMTRQLPAGAIVLGLRVKVTTGFTGDTSAVMTVGKTAGEDQYSDGTSVNVYTAATVGDSPEDPLEFNASAQSIYLRVTGAADFTSISAGKMLVELFYLSTVPEIVNHDANRTRNV
jgi:hypothetical protein